jgi:hypothetical protein
LSSDNPFVLIPTVYLTLPLGVGGMPDLPDLQPLSFLRRPTGLWLFNCGALVDVGGMTRWAETLTSVAFAYCKQLADVAPLALLRQLEDLSLVDITVQDLSPVVGLPRLKVVYLGGDPLPDLAPLRTLPALTRLVIRSGELDLGALAGREGLTVRVERATRVHGADLLGAGSRVVRG